jgi:hypothetical protein
MNSTILILTQNKLGPLFWFQLLDIEKTVIYFFDDQGGALRSMADIAPDLIIIDDYSGADNDGSWIFEAKECLERSDFAPKIYCLSPKFSSVSFSAEYQFDATDCFCLDRDFIAHLKGALPNHQNGLRA